MSSLRRDIRAASMDPDSRIYLSWGTKKTNRYRRSQVGDYETPTAKNNLELAHMLEENGTVTWIVCQRDGSHNKARWEKLVPGFMDFLWLDK